MDPSKSRASLAVPVELVGLQGDPNRSEGGARGLGVGHSRFESDAGGLEISPSRAEDVVMQVMAIAYREGIVSSDERRLLVARV